MSGEDNDGFIKNWRICEGEKCTMFEHVHDMFMKAVGRAMDAESDEKADQYFCANSNPVIKHSKLIVEAIGISFPDYSHVPPIIMMPFTGKRYKYR